MILSKSAKESVIGVNRRDLLGITAVAVCAEARLMPRDQSASKAKNTPHIVPAAFHFAGFSLSLLCPSRKLCGNGILGEAGRMHP